MKAAENMMFLFYPILFIILFGCENKVPRQEELRLYTEVLNQVIYDNYYQLCLAGNDTLHKRLLSGEIQQSDYIKIIDSLKADARRHGKKCEIHYADRLGILMEDSLFREDFKLSIQENLKDTFVINHFGHASIHDVFDKLSKSADLSLDDVKITYVNFISRENSIPDRTGIGAIGISKFYFNKDFDKGIVYYEFNCGRLCGHGQLLFIENRDGAWEVIEYKRLWEN